jgi:hypothetical protein
MKTKNITTPALFSLGQVVRTHGAASLNPQSVLAGLYLHSRGDWGDICAEDKAANDAALKEGGRILSSYTDGNGVKFWIITEADRSSTCVLLPSEY